MALILPQAAGIRLPLTGEKTDERSAPPTLVGSERYGPRYRRWLLGAAPALVALGVCAICWLAGWRGTDWAAQIYRSTEVARHGLAVWSPGWYGGTFPLNYSLVYPLAAAWLGNWPLAGLSAAGSAFCFDRLVTPTSGQRPIASWYFAAATVIPVSIGQLPTLAGEALGLGCILALSHSPSRRLSRLAGGLALGALSGLCSPVTGAFCALALAAMGLASLRREGTKAGAVWLARAGAVFAVTAALPMVFPGPGYFPFEASDAVVILAICALASWRPLGSPSAVRAGAALYAATTAALFVVRNPMGDNAARFAAYIGVPLTALYLARSSRSWPRLARPTALAAAAALAAWQWAPMAEALNAASNGPPSTPAYYQPLLGRLGTLSGGQAVRLEVPPLVHHWESAYIAPTFSLARGWERQLDMAYDPLFYRSGPLRPVTYLAWLRQNGVSYVALANAPLDYSATAEAALLRRKAVPELQLLWHDRSWTLWKVTGSAGLAEPPARVMSIAPGAVVLRFFKAGISTVRVRWSPYWSLGPLSGGACLRRAPGGWTEVGTPSPATLHLHISVLGAVHGHCRVGTLAYHHGVNGR